MLEMKETILMYFKQSHWNIRQNRTYSQHGLFSGWFLKDYLKKREVAR